MMTYCHAKEDSIKALAGLQGGNTVAAVLSRPPDRNRGGHTMRHIFPGLRP